jgi:hypothetical protein
MQINTQRSAFFFLVALLLFPGTLSASSVYERRNGVWSQTCEPGSGYELYRVIQDQQEVIIAKTPDGWETLLAFEPLESRVTDDSVIEEHSYKGKYYILYYWLEGNKLFKTPGNAGASSRVNLSELPARHPETNIKETSLRCAALPADAVRCALAAALKGFPHRLCR